MIRFPFINKRSRVRIYLSKNEFQYISLAEFILLEECEFLEITLYDSSLHKNLVLVDVFYKKNGDKNDRFSKVYTLCIRKNELESDLL